MIFENVFPYVYSPSVTRPLLVGWISLVLPVNREKMIVIFFNMHYVSFQFTRRNLQYNKNINKVPYNCNNKKFVRITFHGGGGGNPLIYSGVGVKVCGEGGFNFNTHVWSPSLMLAEAETITF
jgi:hypothetical protein